MAILENIRNKGGLLVSIVIGLALVAFILGDFLKGNNRSGYAENIEVAEIDGESITLANYQQLVQRNIDDYLRRSNQTNVDESNMITLREQAWNDIINEYVMYKEYKQLGLTCGSEELFDMVQGQNIHPQIKTTQIFQDSLGQFDKARVINFLKNMEQDPQALAAWLDYEQQIKRNTIATKFNNLIDKGLYITNQYAARSFMETSKKVEFSYILKRYSSISDTLISFTDKDVQDYYKNNQVKYKQEETRDIDYISFDVYASQKDKLGAENWINEIKEDFANSENSELFVELNSDDIFDWKYYKAGGLPASINDFMFNAEKDEVFGPYLEDDVYKLAKLNKVESLSDSVKASHILINPASFNNNIQLGIPLAINFVDSLKDLVLNGADFGELAVLHGTDGSAPNKGVMDWFTYGAMVREFNDSVYFGDKGDLKTVITQFGVHLVRIDDKSVSRSKYIQVAGLSRNIVPSQETITETYNKASKFASLYGKPDKFQEGIIEEGLTKRVAPNLRAADRTIGGLDKPRGLIMWAYEAKENEVSKIIEFSDRFVIAQLTKLKKEGIAPLEQVISEIETEVIKKKKAEKIINEMNVSLAKGAPLNDLTEEFGVVIKTAKDATFTGYSISGLGVEPKLSAAVTTMEEGKISQPIEGITGVYVFVVTNIIMPEGNDYTVEIARLNNANLSSGKYRAVEALKELANISDYRTKYY